MQIAYLIFGVNEFSARFFSVIMGVLTILTTWWLTTRYLGERAGFYAALALFSSLHFVLQFHMAVPDPYLIFLTTFGLASFYVFYTGRNIHFPADVIHCLRPGSPDQGTGSPCPSRIINPNFSCPE
jgi:4-amino-4-deoxy-L-arabinose transferase-like glycosyltransferase